MGWIKKAQLAFEKVRTLRGTTYQYKDFLKKGTYYLALESKKQIVSNRSDKSIDFIKNLKRNVQKDKPRKFLFHIFINLLYKIEFQEAGGRFAGDFLMKTRNEDIKIFNFDDELVLTFIKDKKRYDILKENYKYFNKYYNIPFVEVNDKERSILERNIKFKGYRYWNKIEKDNVIRTIYNGINNQLKDIDKSKIKFKTTGSLVQSLSDNLKNNILNMIKDIIPLENYYDKWPLIRCHGDLNFNNILLGDKDIYFVDWDDSNEYIFLYDFINCIFVDALYYKDFYYLNKYFAGDYDQYLKDFFNSMSLIFIPTYRKYYLVIYIIERILEFEIVQNSDILEFLLYKYKDVLNTINNNY